MSDSGEGNQDQGDAGNLYPSLSAYDTPAHEPTGQARRSSTNPFMSRTPAPEDQDDNDITPTAEELQQLKKLRAQGKKTDQTKTESSSERKKPKFTFTMPAATVNIPTLEGASNWDRWYQIVYGLCQTASIHPILTGQMTRPEQEDSDQWDTANSWIEGNIRMSLESGGYTHIAGIHGAHNMIKALESAYKSKGYTSREVLWRIISRASLSDYESITEYVEAIKKAKIKLAELGHNYTWEITTSFLHGLPSSSYESFVEIVLNSRGKDSTGKLLEPDFDDIVEQLLDRERRQKLVSSNDSTNKAMFTNNNKDKPPCSDCGNAHGKICYFQHQDKAPTWWLDRNKDRIDEYNKKKTDTKSRILKSA